MKKKNRAFYRYFIPVIYAVFVYILWELTGTIGGLCGWKGNGQLGGNFIQFLYFHVIQ